jgi:hypothetical protein
LLGRLPGGYNKIQNATDIKQVDFRKGKSRLEEIPFLAQLIFICLIIFRSG